MEPEETKLHQSQKLMEAFFKGTCTPISPFAELESEQN